MKRILVNIVIVLCFAGLAYFCYDEGKSYNLILENLSYTVDGVEHPGIEAMQVTIDDSGDPIYMLEGDQMPGVAAGKKHNLKIEILDEDDKVIETRNIPFHILDLKGKFSINVARAYALGNFSDRPWQRLFHVNGNRILNGKRRSSGAALFLSWRLRVIRSCRQVSKFENIFCGKRVVFCVARLKIRIFPVSLAYKYENGALNEGLAGLGKR